MDSQAVATDDIWDDIIAGPGGAKFAPFRNKPFSYDEVGFLSEPNEEKPQIFFSFSVVDHEPVGWREPLHR
jgi:hypothetical protein